MNSDGGAVRQLTTDPSWDAAPVWSPDESWIAFHSIRSGNFDIYTMTSNGADVLRVTDSFGFDIFPDW
jgi:tricorn protease